MARRSTGEPTQRKSAAGGERGPLGEFARRLADELRDPLRLGPEDIRRLVTTAAGEAGLGPATSDVTLESVYDAGEWSTRVRVEVHL